MTTRPDSKTKMTRIVRESGVIETFLINAIFSWQQNLFERCPIKEPRKPWKKIKIRVLQRRNRKLKEKRTKLSTNER